MKQNLLRPRSGARSSAVRRPRQNIARRMAFYPRLDEAVRDAAFGLLVQEQCWIFTPASEENEIHISAETYFRLLLLGYLERLRSPESIIWHASESTRLGAFVEDLDSDFSASLRGFGFWRQTLPAHLQRRLFGELIRIAHETRVREALLTQRGDHIWPATELEVTATPPLRLNHRLPWRAYLRRMTQTTDTASSARNGLLSENDALRFDRDEEFGFQTAGEVWPFSVPSVEEPSLSTANTLVVDTPVVGPLARAPQRPRPVTPQQGPVWYELSKRCLDVVAASLALLMLAPLFFVIAVLIRWTSSGPVFFRQIRVGRGGREFCCYKFRSMVQDADQMKSALQALSHHANPKTFKIRRDPRTTWIGALLRKYSLDEAPQFFNVLRGDMSLVGPRPPVPSEVSWYTEHELRRLEVRPGLTCTWQVSGRGDIPFEQQVQLDIDYIDRRNFWLDLKLLAQTPLAVATGRGAY